MYNMKYVLFIIYKNSNRIRSGTSTRRYDTTQNLKYSNKRWMSNMRTINPNELASGRGSAITQFSDNQK